MQSKRFDHRSKDEFAKDIKFTTNIETYLWGVFCSRILKHHDYICADHGTDNSGELVAKSSHKADYRLLANINGIDYDLLLEIKFAPTAGKLTFKVQDLNAYIKQNANILLIYNTGPVSLKKPKDHNLENHINKIKYNIKYLKYAILTPSMLKYMLNKYPAEKCYYMGNKLSIIVPSSDFDNTFQGKQL